MIATAFASILTTDVAYPATNAPNLASTGWQQKRQSFTVGGTAGDAIEFSYDGINTHGTIIVGAGGPTVTNQSVSKGVWLRAKAGNAATVKVAMIVEMF